MDERSMSYPAALQEIVDVFAPLSESERRETLIDLASAVTSCARRAGESYDFAEVRRDQECSDTVGIFLRLDAEKRAYFAVELGPKVQTLTRALTTILCQGLNGCVVEEILAVKEDFVTRIIGAELVRLRSQTVYYVLRRIQAAVQLHLDQRVAAASVK